MCLLFAFAKSRLGFCVLYGYSLYGTASQGCCSSEVTFGPREELCCPSDQPGPVPLTVESELSSGSRPSSVSPDVQHPQTGAKLDK